MIANEYAKALFELTATASVERIDSELELLCEAFAENPDVIKVLEAPNIAYEDKKNLIVSISKDFDELLQRFLLVILDNSRYDSIYEIKNEYHNMVSNTKKVIEATVTSKVKLTEEQIKVLEKAVSPKFGGLEVKINNIVDKSLIGGLKVVAEGKRIDMSIKGKIRAIKSTL